MSSAAPKLHVDNVSMTFRTPAGAFAVSGGVAEHAGAMSATEYEGLVDEVRAAHHDPLHANYLVRFPTMVAAVGTRPRD